MQLHEDMIESTDPDREGGPLDPARIVPLTEAFDLWIRDVESEFFREQRNRILDDITGNVWDAGQAIRRELADFRRQFQSIGGAPTTPAPPEPEPERPLLDIGLGEGSGKILIGVAVVGAAVVLFYFLRK